MRFALIHTLGVEAVSLNGLFTEVLAMLSLAEMGVGAICLQNASTDFSLMGENNQANGMIRRTGIFLYESGMAGTVQHVDLGIHSDGETSISICRADANKIAISLGMKPGHLYIEWVRGVL